ncbi:MAG: TRAP transporter substrate-binding protein [Eubacteriales bacterium]|jgi:tripartite ATP-independent transporter DctP family solute receptor
MKKFVCALMALMVAASLAGCGGDTNTSTSTSTDTSTSTSTSTEQADPLTFRFAHIGIPGEILTQYADEYAVRINEATGGAVSFDIYGNSALGNVEEMINGVKNGTIDIGMHDFASLEKFVPDMAAFNCPFVFDDAAHSMRVTDPYSSEIMMNLNEELVQAANMRIIANCYRGARELTCTFPVYSPADLAGKKIRGVSNPVWMTMIEGMGATPTPVEYSELATALATGVVDGQENPLNNIYSSKMYEVQPYIMMTNHMQAIQTIFMNENSWQSISEDNQKIMEDVAVEMGDLSIQWTEDGDKQIIEELTAAGITFIDESNGLKLDEFKEAVLAKVNEDYPEWAEMIEQMQAMK